MLFVGVLSLFDAHIPTPYYQFCAGLCSGLEHLHAELNYIQHFHLDVVHHFPQSHHCHLQQHLHALRSGTCMTNVTECVYVFGRAG